MQIEENVIPPASVMTSGPQKGIEVQAVNHLHLDKTNLLRLLVEIATHQLG